MDYSQEERTLYVTTRRVPGHVWVRLFVSFTGECEPGHGWMYKGIVRRDVWRIGRLGFGILRMPVGERRKKRAFVNA